VLAVLVERGRTDEAELAAGEHRLEHVPGVHGALAARTRSDDGVDLVDEGDDLPVAVADLLEHRLEPLLELAAVLRAREHRREVERVERLVAQALGHIALDDALREALDDRGLADARLADEDRVVLGAPGQDLHHPADLGVTADHRVELSLPGTGGEIGAVLGEGLVGPLRVVGRHRASTAQLWDRLLDRVGVEAELPGARERQEQMVRGYVGVAHRRHVLLGLLDGGKGGARELGLLGDARHLGQRGHRLLGGLGSRGDAGAGGLQQRGSGGAGLGCQREQQVCRLDVRVVLSGGGRRGLRERLLRLVGQL
jgi:hypothetical protein